ncbi:hypothetical protein GCM10027155_09390 [Acinetobacter apis]|uniref:Transcriptional regulator, AlpA family n=1 Tax=Acinetobacter apis TaxID=1229165 RepID=A0A217EEU9_9GAMM|nr:hypothetical protein SAMN05444584_0949 [Acinetobacter apis]
MKYKNTFDEEDRLLKTSDITQIIGLTQKTVHTMIVANNFPPPDWVNPDNSYKYWWKSTIYKYFNKKETLIS